MDFINGCIVPNVAYLAKLWPHFRVLYCGYAFAAKAQLGPRQSWRFLRRLWHNRDCAKPVAGGGPYEDDYFASTLLDDVVGSHFQYHFINKNGFILNNFQYILYYNSRCHSGIWSR